MITALLLLVFLILSVSITKIIGIRLGFIHLQPTVEEQHERNLRATAVAVALASLYPRSPGQK